MQETHLSDDGPEEERLFKSCAQERHCFQGLDPDTEVRWGSRGTASMLKWTTGQLELMLCYMI